MLVSLSWLEKFVDIPVSTPVLIEDLTMTGLNVERSTATGFSDPNVVVGHVLEVSRHPNADKLSLCRVLIEPNEAPREIVCGAPNVARGQQVLVALPGAALPGGNRIRRAKIRGVTSDGMICSEAELGVGNDAGGIMVLDKAFAPGTPVETVLPPPNTILEIEVTPNRPDLLSHLGVAREIAAIYNVSLRLDRNGAGDGGPRDPDFTVRIEKPADCPRYVGKRVSGIRVGPSPQWLATAIESVGLHSVNNVVDATNYVMMELGQPLHAFDFRKVRGSEIIVRRAQPDEKLLALDGETHELNGDILAICDAGGATALAGIIGGEESAVHEESDELLIESANFDPVLVRRGRRQLAIQTDASYRFERGVDREMCRIAAERAAALIVEVAGGRVGPIVDSYPGRLANETLVIRRNATSRQLGVSLACEEIASLLERLSFEVRSQSDEEVSVQVPSFRPDVIAEIDLIEEVARLYGYNRIGKGWSYRCTTAGSRDPFDAYLSRLSSHMTGRRFTEVVTSSFTDGRELDDFGWDADDPRTRPVPIRNPLNINHRYLRTSLLPGMLDAVRRNIDYDVRHIRMYQIGKVFVAAQGGDELPEEQTMLSIVITRPEGKDFWNDSNKSLHLVDLKKEIEMLLQALRIDLGSGLDYTFDGSTGRFVYTMGGNAVIEGGVVPEAVGERYDFDQPVWCASLQVDELYRHAAPDPKFKPLGEYPSSKRDLSLVARRGIGFSDIEKSLVKSGGPLLDSLQVFDVYTAENLGADATAYGVRLNFRSPERTLTDADVDPIIAKIIENLKKQLGVELRS